MKTMKQMGTFLLAALLSATGALGAAAQEGLEARNQQIVKPTSALEEFPRIDGSLACVPMMEKLVSEVTGCTEAQAEEAMELFTNTNPCYLHLAEGERDLILAYEPAAETVEQLKDYEPLNLQAIGKDALVFITNKDNPVESLTMEQVIGIYTGKITNWSEVGGNDIEIVAFSRPETSGSQTLMRKLLLGDAEMVSPQMMEVSTMEAIIEKVNVYQNTANAIGYSVYYYASQMFGQPNLKFISIEGVAPDNGSIQSGTYPLVNEFYCGTNGQSSELALRLQEWLVSEEGQAFVARCGYVPVGLVSSNEVIAVPSGNGRAKLYDWQGNYLNSIPFFYEPGAPLFWPKKSTKIVWGKTGRAVHSLETGEVLMELDREKYSINRDKDMFVTMDLENGKVRLYNYQGELQYEDCFTLIPEIESSEAQVVRLTDASVIYLQQHLEEGKKYTPNPVIWVYDDGSVKQIMNTELQELLDRYETQAFGEYLTVKDWNTDQNYIINSDGKKLGHDWCRFVSSYDALYEGSTVLAIAEEGDHRAVYDASLTKIAEISFDVKYPEYKDGFLTGMCYEELGNEECYGFLNCENASVIPFAYKGAVFSWDEDGDRKLESAEGCYLWLGGKTMYVPLGYREYPTSANENLIMITNKETDVKEIRRIDTGETVWTDAQTQYAVYATLGEGYYMLRDTDEGKISILDLYGKTLYESESYVAAMPVGHGLFFAQRGIYQGLMDKNGEWVIKLIPAEE